MYFYELWSFNDIDNLFTSMISTAHPSISLWYNLTFVSSPVFGLWKRILGWCLGSLFGVFNPVSMKVVSENIGFDYLQPESLKLSSHGAIIFFILTFVARHCI